MDFTILSIQEISPPFYLIGSVINVDTDISDNYVLRPPSVRFTGTIITSNSELVQFLQEQIEHGTDRISNNKYLNNYSFFKYVGQVAVTFVSNYPLKTYPKITTNSKVFIGDPSFGYQGEKAEIRYTVNGKIPNISSKLYKREIIFKDNVSGTENISLRYRVFYKSKISPTEVVNFGIVKSGNNFYNYAENNQSTNQ